jgi:hypothetical protein
MTLRYPPAKWEPLGPQTEPQMVAHNILCFHTMVGSLSGTSNMFHANGYGGTESHFGVGASVAEGIEQWQDLMHEADANLEGHVDVVSIETADYGGVFGTWNTSDDRYVPPWTAAQLDMLVKLTVWFCRKETHAGCPSTWACHKYGVPCELIPDTKPGRRGIGYHKQGCDPWRVAGGRKWSLALGKGCPGPARINQLVSIIIPRARAILAGTTAGEWDEMATKAEVQAASYAADYQYGIDFWVHGTGAALIRQVSAIAAATVANGNAIAALAAQNAAEDVADDTEFRAAVAKINQADADLKAAVDKLAGGVVPTPPKV